MQRTAVIIGVLVLVTLASALSTHAAECHVAQDGSGDFTTISSAAETMTAGDVCYVHSGVYRETVRLHTNDVTFKAYPGEYVLISGCDTVENWTRHEGGSIYKAPFRYDVEEFDFTQLFVDGRHIRMARQPNNDEDYLSAASWAEIKLDPKVSPAKAYFLDGMDSPADYWKGGLFMCVVGNMWRNPQGMISSSQGNEIVCDVRRSSDWGGRLWAVLKKHDARGLGFIINHLNALDSPGEWHCEDETLYLRAPDDADPNGLAVEARTRRFGFVLDGASNVSIEGVHFKAASVAMVDTKQCIMDSCTVRYPVPFMDHIDDYVYNVDDSKGVFVSGEGNVIRNCYVGRSWGDAITLSGKKHTIENCLLEETNWIANYSATINPTDATQITVRRNTMRRGGRAHVHFAGMPGSEISHNHLHDAMCVTEDGGICYAFKSDHQGTVFHHNIMHDAWGVEAATWKEHNAKGLYIDNNCSNLIAHHNVFYNFPQSSIRLNANARNVNLYNNTCWNTREPINGALMYDRLWQNVNIHNNLTDVDNFLNNATRGDPSSTIDRKNNLAHGNAERLFVDFEAGDFTLRSGSPAIDKGIAIPGITNGSVGEAPDVGAYEWEGAAWKAGASLTMPEFPDETGD